MFYYFALSAPHCCVSSSKAFLFTSLPKRIYHSKFLSVPAFGLYCHHHTVITISGQVSHKSRREKKLLPTDIPRHLNLIYRIAHAKAAFPLFGFPRTTLRAQESFFHLIPYHNAGPEHLVPQSISNAFKKIRIATNGGNIFSRKQSGGYPFCKVVTRSLISLAQS